MPFCAPQIVYSNSWLNQTSAIAQTTIFTPSVGSVYRLTVLSLVEGTDANVNALVQSSGSSNQAQANAVSSASGGPGSQVSDDEAFVGQTSMVLKFSTSISGAGLTSYDVYVVIEQLA